MVAGIRGIPPADTEALERVLVSLSEMVMNHPEISQLDINSLMVYEKGKATVVADCRIILETSGNGKVSSESRKP